MSDCVVEISEFIPLNVCDRVPAGGWAPFKAAFRESALRQVPSGWTPQTETVDILTPRGRILALRATKKPETSSGDCDGTCEMCSQGRSSYVLTGVAP